MPQSQRPALVFEKAVRDGFLSAGSTERVHPNLLPLVRAYPLPNLSNNFSGNFYLPVATPAETQGLSVRLDYNANQRHAFWGRFHYSPSDGQSRLLSTLTRREATTQTATLAHTWNVSSRLVSETRLNWSQTRGQGRTDFDGFGGAEPPPASAFLPSGFDFQNVQLSLPGLVVGPEVAHLQRQINITQNFSFVTDKHSWRWGVDYRHLFPRYTPPAYQIAIEPSASLNSNSARYVVHQRTASTIKFHNFSAYAEDNWKVASRLTFNLGLRWEVVPPPQGRATLLPDSGIRDAGQINYYQPTETSLWQTGYQNSAPRLGFAYRLSSAPQRETVLRGGAGLFYDLGAGVVSEQAANIPNWRFSGFYFTSLPAPNLTPQPSAPLCLTLRVFTDPCSASVFERNIKLPSTLQWNLTLQQSLGAGQTLTAAYVGAAGRNLLSRNAVNTYLGNVVVTNSQARSDYHALQTQYQQRLSRGFQALAAYTFAKSLDTASDDATRQRTLSLLHFNNAGGIWEVSRGPSDFDVRHNFSLALTYDWPALSGSGWQRKLTQGWSTNLLFKAQSALPVNVTSSDERPSLLLGVPLYVRDSNQPGGRSINPAAFEFADAFDGKHGSLGRNALRSLPLWQADASLQRTLKVTSKLKLRLVAEVFNVFNHANFAPPTGRYGESGFGVPETTFGSSLGGFNNAGGMPLYSIGGPRSLQFGARLSF